MPTALITGASRGIGLGLARAYAAKGWQVIGCCRTPETATDLADIKGKVAVERLDVADTSSVRALADRLSGCAIDVLINNAGIGGQGVALPSLNFDVWRQVMDTNLYGPAAMVDAFLPHVLVARDRKIVNISSTLGSIARATGGNYAYRSSKAALNMTMRAMAADLMEQGVILVLLSPGIVDTDFTRGGRMPKISVGESVHGMMQVIDDLTQSQSGTFLRYSGEVVPW